ncbi:MAG: glycosyltransferase family 2 protein [Ruminococcaceae bacterium]|nr:glycosyltransferase family 2 protein [Oscillospiraceae bacterium]
MELISVMVPCYNEEESLPLFREEILRVMASMPEYAFEVIFADDGSKDKTLHLLREFAAGDDRFRYVSFTRNFGKEAAMYALLQASKGDFVVYMDADLQDPPSLLPRMMALLKEKGCDSIGTRRSSRKGEPPIRSFFANVFYKMINRISNVRLVPAARDYRLMSRRMADSILSLCEYNRFSKGIFEWVGYETEWISYENVERSAGKTKFSFWKLFKYSLECIIAFSTAPLAIASVMGFVFCFAAFIGILVVIIRALLGVDSAFGWASMMCVILFVGGVLEFSIGILGGYLSKTYLESKHRPIYLSKETENDLKEKDHVRLQEKR